VVSALFLSGVLFDCSREHPRERYIARVDGSTLTAEELAAACDTTGGKSNQTRGYINDWVTTELLFQEAVRRGIPETDVVRKQIALARKQLSISAFLDQELAFHDSTSFPDKVLKSAFDSAAASFALREDVVTVSYALFSDRDAANTFRSRVLRGSSWHDVLQQTMTDSVAHSRLLAIADHRYFTHASLYPEELWKLAQSLGKDAVSFVVRTTDGYYVLQAHGMKHQGSTPDFEYVKDEIRYRLQTESRRRQYEQLLRTLRTKHTIEMSVATDSTSGEEHASANGG
jgi:hypothetical protein